MRDLRSIWLAVLTAVGLLAASAVPSNAAPAYYQPVNSVAALSALGVTAPLVLHATLLGYYTASDGGGGDVDWVSPCPVGSTDGAVYFPASGVSLSSGCWKRNVTVPNFNASQGGIRCDGTDETTRWTAVSATGLNTTISPQKACAGQITISGGQTLDCQGSTLSAVPSAAFVLKGTGFNPTLKNCGISDGNGYTMLSTTLSATANPADTTFTVSSGSRWAVGQVLSMTLDCGSQFVSTVKTVAGTTITPTDPIPECVTGTPTVSAGGAGYALNDILVVQGGSGAPAVLKVTGVTAGAITSVSVLVPGLYATFPTSPVSILDTGNRLGLGGTLTIAGSGASSGNAVRATMGTVVLDLINDATVANIKFGVVPGGIHLMNSTLASGFSQNNAISNVVLNSSLIFGIDKDVGVANSVFNTITGYGYGGSVGTYGASGLYINGDGVGSGPTGGNKFTDVSFLNSEIELLGYRSQLDTFTSFIADTTRNYGVYCYLCDNNVWNQVEATFSGPTAISGTANQGAGFVVVDPVGDQIGSLRTANNGIDLHVSLSGSVSFPSLWLNSQNWSSTKNASGGLNALAPGTALFNTQTPPAVGGSGSTIYMGAGGYSATANAPAFTQVSGNFTITSFTILSGSAPGAAQTYTVNLLRNATVLGSCVISGASTFLCSYNGPGIPVTSADNLTIQIVSSASAASGSFRGNVIAY